MLFSQRILGGPLFKPCSVSSVQLLKTSLGLEWEQYYRQPVLNQDLPGGPLEIPKGPLEAPFSLGSLKDLGVPGASLGGP